MATQIKQRFSKLPSVKPASINFNKALQPLMILCSIAVVVAFVIVMMLWNSKEQYRPIYGEHENYDQTQVISSLDQSGIDFYVDPKFGQVMVSSSQLSEARMAIAAAGIKPQGPTGFESLATDSSLGTSQFIENARYKHSLEGELARSIMTLDAISNVRVHLAIPKQTLFVRRDKELPTASVIVSLLPGRQLQTQQVEAITNLVSGSVTGLSPSNVNVIDQNGNLLSSSGPNNQASGDSAYLNYLDSLEQTYIERASKMLQPMMGLHNFRVEVTADINFDLIEATEESFEPDSVVRSEFSSFDRNSTKDAVGVPGALSNQAPDEEATNDSPVKNERGENSREYAIDRTVKNIKYQQGAIKQLSVSVLLNGKPETFNEAQLKDLKAMLTNALGINTQRGDAITLTVFPFSETDENSISTTPDWWQQVDWLSYWQYLLLTIIALAILLIVVKPLMRKLSDNQTASVAVIENTLSTNDELIQLDTDNTSQDELVIDDGNEAEKDEVESIIRDLPTAETGLEEQTAYLQMLSEKEPERVAHVVKQWMNTKNADN